MKTEKYLTILALVSALLLLGSCAGFDEAQTIIPASGSEAVHPMSRNHFSGYDCSHQQDYLGSPSGASFFSMSNSFLAFCSKCGRYVRARQ